MKMEEHIYTFPKGFKLLTPFCTDVNDIKKELTQTPECIRNVSTYPNGFVIDMNQYADIIIVKTNKKLITNPDGTLSVEL